MNPIKKFYIQRSLVWLLMISFSLVCLIGIWKFALTIIRINQGEPYQVYMEHKISPDWLEKVNQSNHRVIKKIMK